jgi:hypothetical protein
MLQLPQQALPLAPILALPAALLLAQPLLAAHSPFALTRAAAAVAAASAGSKNAIADPDAADIASSTTAADRAAAIAAGLVPTHTTAVTGAAAHNSPSGADKAAAGAKNRYRKIHVPAPAVSESAKEEVRVTRSMTRKRRLEPIDGVAGG